MDLIAILQRDALKLMDLKEEEIPLYSASDVESMMAVCEWRHVGEPFVVGEVQVTYLPASHILGAAMVFLETPAGNVLFTGDYSVSAQKTVPALRAL